MSQILYFLIGVVVGGIVVVFVYARKEAARHGTNTAEELVGICKSTIESGSRKEARKQEALDLFRQKDELSNHEMRQALGISSRTAVRYMDELEQEGKVEQVGRAGHAVTYRLK